MKKGAVTPAKLTTATKKALIGPAGAQGLPGAPGAAGATNIVVRVGQLEEEVATASCQGSEVAVGGGGFALEPGTFLWGSEPVTAASKGNPEGELKEGERPTGWQVGAEEATGGKDNVGVRAYVLCASP